MSPSRKTTILVVEDDPHLRTLYRLTLAHAGYAVVAVGDGVDALRHLEVATPDAVVLDIGLPRLEGRDVKREMAAHPRTSHVPIVVVTGSETLIQDADHACVLRKPIDPEALIAAVEKCLGRDF